MQTRYSGFMPVYASQVITEKSQYCKKWIGLRHSSFRSAKVARIFQSLPLKSLELTRTPPLRKRSPKRGLMTGIYSPTNSGPGPIWWIGDRQRRQTGVSKHLKAWPPKYPHPLHKYFLKKTSQQPTLPQRSTFNLHQPQVDQAICEPAKLAFLLLQAPPPPFHQRTLVHLSQLVRRFHYCHCHLQRPLQWPLLRHGEHPMSYLWPSNAYPMNGKVGGGNERSYLQVLCSTDIFDNLPFLFGMNDSSEWTWQKGRNHVQRPIRRGQSDNLPCNRGHVHSRGSKKWGTYI